MNDSEVKQKSQLSENSGLGFRLKFRELGKLERDGKLGTEQL